MIARLVFIAGLILKFGGVAQAFTLLDFPIQSEILSGKWFDWHNPRLSIPYCPNGRGNPFTLTYRIDADFMADEPPPVRTAATGAVMNALQSWSDATQGFVSFRQSDWPAVTNCDTTTSVQPGCPQPCSVIFAAFEGPPFAQWQQCTGGVQPFCSTTCWPNAICPVLPGWGANIDFYTRPNGFVLCSNGFRYEMTPQRLGFTAVHRRSDGIYSIDIYLNQSYAWTTESLAARIPLGLPMPGCGQRASASLLPAGDELWDVVAQSTLFDIETVVLHELGHALGLDHPNEVCMPPRPGGPGTQIDPLTYQFLPCGTFDPAAVMNGTYTGERRTLADDDIGGISYLYKPALWGDLDADGAISLLDAVRAFALADPNAAPTPYEINILDLNTRNGRIDADEAYQVLQWAFFPESGTPGITTDKGRVGVSMPPPTSVTLNATITPSDVGVGGVCRVAVRIENPNAVPFAAWDIDVTYNNAVFDNPRITNGTFLVSGAWVGPGPDDGNIRFAKFGVGAPDNATAGTLGVIEFDINLAQIAAAPAMLQFQFNDVQLVADAPFIHTYGMEPGLQESLTIQNPTVIAYQLDADGNHRIDLNDLYAFFASPYDVSKNGSTTQYDADALEAAIRLPELPDVNAGR